MKTTNLELKSYLRDKAYQDIKERILSIEDTIEEIDM